MDGVNVTASGDVSFENVGGTVKVTAGDSVDAVASIGHGDSAGSTTNTDVFSGFISVSASAVQLIGAQAGTTSATIGFERGTSVSFAVNPLSEVAVNASNDIVLHAATGNAVIGYYSVDSFSGTLSVDIDQLKVSSSNGNISLYGGQTPNNPLTQFSQQGTAFIGTTSGITSPAVSQSNIRVQAPNGTLSLFGELPGSGFNFGLAAICNATGGNTAPYNIDIEVANVYLTGGNIPSMAPSGGLALIQAQQNMVLDSTEDLQLIGGAGVARITTGNGLLTFGVGKDLILQGGPLIAGNTLPGSVQIGAPSQSGGSNVSILFTEVGGDVVVQGGTVAGAYAVIGNGRGGADNTVPNGDVTFASVGGNFTVQAQSEIAHVGLVGNVTTPAVNGTGNVRIDQVGGTLAIFGGTAANVGAAVGYGDPQGNSGDSYTGQLVVNANGIELTGGTASGTQATIGFAGNSAGITVYPSSGITVTSADDIIVQSYSVGGTAPSGNAVIGYYNAAGTPTVSLANMEVTSIGGDITVNGAASGTIGLIGTFATAGVVQSNLSVVAKNALNLYGEPVRSPSSGGTASIANGSTALPSTNNTPFDLFISANDVLLMGGNPGRGYKRDCKHLLGK